MSRIWAFLTILTCLGQGDVMGSELTQLGGTAELEARIAALEEQVAEHDAEARARGESVSYLPDANQPAVPSACGSCGPCVGYDFACGRCRTTGFYGGAEVMWLKPFGSGDMATQGINGSSADTFLPGWRLWGGQQNCDGLGWRVNWWQWDQFSTSGAQSPVPPFTNTDTLHLVFQKLDLLVTQMVSFRKWDLMLLGGVTYAGNTFNAEAPPPGGVLSDGLNTTSRFDGWGLTAGLLAYRDIAWLQGLKGYGSAQWSGVYGNTARSWSTPSAPTPIYNDANSTLLNILELKVGTQYERRIGWGAIGFVSAGFEAQYWGGIDGLQLQQQGVYAVSNAVNDLGLVGFTVGTGIRR